MNSTYCQPDPIVLSFNDSCLRMSDVQLLQGPHWLNDQILSFYFEYLQQIKYKNTSDILFVSPEVTQCMKMLMGDDFTTLLQQVNATGKQFIFFALNDNETTNAGGSHWSLLVFSKPEQSFYHFDSSGSSNNDVFKEFAAKLKLGLNCHQCQVKPLRCLQQMNNYDCGIHVICMADTIADYINRFDFVEGVGSLHHDIVNSKRSELLKLIQSLGGKF